MNERFEKVTGKEEAGILAIIGCGGIIFFFLIFLFLRFLAWLFL